MANEAHVPTPTGYEDFELDSVSIDSIDGGHVEWNLSFGWRKDPDWVLDIYLEDWKIVDTGLMH